MVYSHLYTREQVFSRNKTSSFPTRLVFYRKSQNKYKQNIKLSDFKKEYQGSFTNLAGKIDLLTTAAVLKNADLFVGNDSGLGHLASAVKTKTFTIFGPGEPNRYKPWGILAYYFQDKENNIYNIKPRVVFSEIVNRFEYKL